MIPFDTVVLVAIEPHRLRYPYVQGTVPCGFPSPADDFAVKRLDLITHPLATFFWRAAGLSMIDAGIGDGDILVVDRAVVPVHQHVVAQVDGDFTCKYLHKRAGRVKLVPANPTYPEISFRDGQELIISGVVIFCIKRFLK